MDIHCNLRIHTVLLCVRIDFPSHFFCIKGEMLYRCLLYTSRGDSVVLDIGGILDNYCSDMTRTVFIGEVSDRAREVYEVVKDCLLYTSL